MCEAVMEPSKESLSTGVDFGWVPRQDIHLFCGDKVVLLTRGVRQAAITLTLKLRARSMKLGANTKERDHATPTTDQESGV